LAEQYDANEDLAEIRRDIGYRLRDRWIHSRRRFVQNLWFRTISRAVQVRTAQACARLDRRYVPHRFSIDHLLWPSQLVDLRVRETLGEPALDELRAVRRRLFHRVFHSDVDLAHKLMHKAIYPNFFAATVLRRRYDPEYLLGELTDAWSVDIRRHNRAFRQTPRMRRRRIRIRRQARARHHRLRLFLAEHPDLRPANCESLRALRIAYHTNHQNLRARIDRGVDRADRSSLHALDRHPQSIDSMVRDIAQNPTPFTRKLLSIRLHHELARLELEDYEFYLERILK
jgi:hypothetical protein